MTTRSFIRTALPALLLAAALAPRPAQQAGRAAGKTAPDLANVKYGPHERNVLDLWKAKSDKPTPLVVFIHGGGFRGGSKEALSPALLDGLLAKGISVMAINYRLSPEVSFPAHYMDCARAIQFARSKAKEWNLDPKRVGATGGSAGAGTSLWIGFHDDMADPKNADPVLRESTRLTCMAVHGAQSTYDPRVIKEWVGEAAAKHPALRGLLRPQGGRARHAQGAQALRGRVGDQLPHEGRPAGVRLLQRAARTAPAGRQARARASTTSTSACGSRRRWTSSASSAPSATATKGRTRGPGDGRVLREAPGTPVE